MKDEGGYLKYQERSQSWQAVNKSNLTILQRRFSIKVSTGSGMDKKKNMEKTKALISQEVIQSKILFFREAGVMFDSDLALLYNVPTFRLNEAAKRNRKRFPEDFMFQLTRTENITLLAFFETKLPYPS